MARAKRFIKEYGISEYDAYVLVQEKKLAEYFEDCVREGAGAKSASNWIQTELLAMLNSKNIAIEDCPINFKAFAGLLKLMEAGTVSGKTAKDVLQEMAATGKAAEVIVKEKGLTQVSDTGLIEKAVEKAIAANPNAVAEFKAGKQKALGAIVGMVMKETGGKANPKIVNEILCQKLQH